MTSIAPTTVRKTVAWYWDGLGLGRSAGLHDAHTARPHGARSPHRMQRSYRRFMPAILRQRADARSVPARWLAKAG